MTQILTDLLVAIMCGVITWAVRTTVKQVIPFLEAKLKESQYSWAAEIISSAVRAYEQTVHGPGMGDTKFELVIEFVTRELNKHHIYLSDEQITVLIEAAVQAMNSEQIIIEEPTTEE